MKLMRVLSALLALLMLATCLVACKKDGGEEAATTTAAGAAVETQSSLFEENGGGRDFVALTRKVNEGDFTYQYGEMGVVADETSGRVDQAVYERDLYLNETFNVNIVTMPENRSDMVTALREVNMSGMAFYDIVMPMTADTFALGLEGALYEFDSIPYVDVTQEHWNLALYNTTSIGGYNFFAQGSANISAYNSVGVTYFNKQLIQDLTLENPYDLVKNNQWTFEKMKTMCAAATEEVDGVNGMDWHDRYGLAINNFAWQPFFYASGNMLVEKGEGDIPTLSVITPGSAEIVSEVLGQISTFFNDANATILRQTAKFNASEVVTTMESDIFMDDRSLFYIENVYGQILLRDMKTDYGILPMPKYYDHQDRYYHTVSKDNASVMFLPVTHSDADLEALGTVISAISEYSMHLVTPAYYDVQLKYRDSRDDESGEMLDLIFASRTFDIADAYNWGGIIGQYTQLDMNMASRFESVITAAKMQIQEMIDDMELE